MASFDGLLGVDSRVRKTSGGVGEPLMYVGEGVNLRNGEGDMYVCGGYSGAHDS